MAQTVTISVATAGDFSLDLGFSCLTGVLGFLLKIWGLFDSGQILEICCITVFSVQEYSSFIGVMCRVSTIASTM